MEKTGSSESTSRYTRHATDGTVLVPAGVTVTRPLTGDTWSGTGAGRPHAAATSAHAAAAITTRRFDLQPICPPCRATPSAMGGRYPHQCQPNMLGYGLTSPLTFADQPLPSPVSSCDASPAPSEVSRGPGRRTAGHGACRFTCPDVQSLFIGQPAGSGGRLTEPCLWLSMGTGPREGPIKT